MVAICITGLLRPRAALVRPGVGGDGRSLATAVAERSLRYDHPPGLPRDEAMPPVSAKDPVHRHFKCLACRPKLLRKRSSGRRSASVVKQIEVVAETLAMSEVLTNCDEFEFPAESAFGSYRPLCRPPRSGAPGREPRARSRRGSSSRFTRTRGAPGGRWPWPTSAACSAQGPAVSRPPTGPLDGLGPGSPRAASVLPEAVRTARELAPPGGRSITSPC